MNAFLLEIASGKFKHIIVLTGAGISTNAGIPDYRSSNGLFARSAGFDEIRKYTKDAEPFSAHKLCKWLHDKGWLMRVYTQNIDGLHQKANLPDDMIVEFHGSLIKGNMIQYGDPIPPSVLSQVTKDFVHSDTPIDLVIIMGTCLQVAPFCALPNLVPRACTRVLVDIHPENAYKNAWSYRKPSQYREGLYDSCRVLSTSTKFGKRKVTLRPYWEKNRRWKSQHIVSQDTDDWSIQVMGE